MAEKKKRARDPAAKGGASAPGAKPAHLSPADLAARLGVPPETVYAWNKQGTSPRYMRFGRHVRYRLADVEAWEASRTVGRGHAGVA